MKLKPSDITRALHRLHGALWAGLLGLALSMPAHAVPIPIGIGGFSGGETVVDYGLVQTLAPVDGVTFGGVLHNFSIGGSPSNDATIDGGPGNTNNVTVANVEGNTAGVLSLLFPALQTRMGYGYAVSGTGIIIGATSVELFDAGNVSLGILSFNAAPDPNFPGGFAGVESTTPFLRAEVTWNAQAGGRFAFDNLRFESQQVPEPGTALLVGLALAGLGMRRRRAPAA